MDGRKKNSLTRGKNGVNNALGGKTLSREVIRKKENHPANSGKR